MDITPSTAAVASATYFLQKVIGPALEDIGGILADRAKIWRFKNQVDVLNICDDYLKSKNITTRKVNLKVLAPLIEGCSMEDDKTLQQKWAALIANTVKEGSDLDTTLYSHILSQMTKGDADILN
ncbi:MAG: hypothetical protein WKF97_08380 [Chitinophagaceae bacterium]